MKHMPLPPELAQWSGNADLAYRGNNEWSSACPYCYPGGRGGHDPSDRFRMFSEGGPPRAWCRVCDQKVIARQGAGHKITVEDKRIARERYYAWLKEENKRLRKKVRWLQDQDFWRRWHDEMSEDTRQMWRDAGISDTLIDLHNLGYTMEQYKTSGGAMTLPYIHQDKIQTLQFRLMIPPATGDKYRFEKGTKATWFYPWPYDTIERVVLVAEGAKKSMVLWQHAGQLTYNGVDVTIIASPSKHIPNRMIDELDDAEVVILMLDPDAYMRGNNKAQTAIERNATAIGVEKCRHVRTMGKIDDMILEHGLDHAWVQAAVNQASPVIMRNPGRKPTTRYI